MADFKLPEKWTPEKEQEEKDMENIIIQEQQEEEKDSDILIYDLLISVGLA